MKDKINAFLAGESAQKILFFNEMLTPKLIRLAYWLCLLSVLWMGLRQMFSGGFPNFLEGIVYIVIGSILARVAAELVILLFKLNENMESVVANTKGASSKPATRKKVTKKVAKKA